MKTGITGLWQVSRTRAEGLDFQEWIRFDLEYVERMSWTLDAKIILKTVDATCETPRYRHKMSSLGSRPAAEHPT